MPQRVKDTVKPFPVDGLACYLDFEYREDEVLCVVCLIEEPGHSNQLVRLDLRSDPGLSDFRELFAHLVANEATFVGHAVGIAEMEALLRLGFDLRGTRWIDTHAECKMIGDNHPHLGLFSLTYLDCLSAFQIPQRSGKGRTYKEEMRRLILDNSEYTDEEFANILDYCESDVTELPDLLAHVFALHVLSGALGLKSAADHVDFARYRGAYILCDTLCKWYTRGVPVDEVFWNDIKTYQTEIRDTLCRKSNEHYEKLLGVEFFHAKKKITQSDYAFGVKRFGEWVDTQAGNFFWEKTRSGRPRLDNDYVSDGVRRVPILSELKATRDMLNALKAVRLDIVDGYAASGSRTFHTVTGRNQPMVKEGFIFNMAPVFRVAGTKPEPGMAIVAADWSKQEPAIAIALSGDENYRKLYDSEDLYLACAIRAGAAPADATKYSHPIIRQAFKAAMLGIGYGMGHETLAAKIYAEVNSKAAQEVMTRHEANQKAGEILAWHRREFSVMWRYLYSRAAEARNSGWVAAEDGWLTYVNKYTSQTQLINFPIQANGAAMLRQAIISLQQETDLDIPFTLHDAVYVNCREADVDTVKAILRDHMNRAARAIMPEDNFVPIHIGFKTITADSPLDDERADSLLPLLRETIDQLRARDTEFNRLISFGRAA